MAEKRPKSILSGLKNMLHRESEKPSEPAPKSPAPARKKAAAPAKETTKAPAVPPADAPAGQEPAPEAKPEKKVKNQPWYRHRQRW
jgi:hypothetical protein